MTATKTAKPIELAPEPPAILELMRQREIIDIKIRERCAWNESDPWGIRPYHEVPKRLLTVAAVSRRSVLLFGPPAADIYPIIVGAVRLGVAAAYVYPCPCGYLSDPRHACACTQAATVKTRKAWPVADMYGQVSGVPCRDMKARANGRRGTSLADMTERVNAARAIRPAASLALDETSTRLLYCAVTELGLPVDSRQQTIELAVDIAALDGSTTIRCEHVAEAVQYRRPR